MRTHWTLLTFAGALSLAACEGENNNPNPARTPTPSVQTVPPTTATPSDRVVTTPPANVDRDNSGVNVRDRAENAPTAGMAGQSKSEVELAANIRKKLTDTQLSTNAQNAKIVVQGTRVTLRGPVKSQEEKDAVGRIATEFAGEANVDNLLEIEVNQ